MQKTTAYVKSLKFWHPSLILTLWGFLLAGMAAGAVWAAEGHPLVFVRNGEIWLADTFGQGARQLTSGAGLKWDDLPSLSPDGRWVAFSPSTEQPRTIKLVPVGGGPVTTLRPAGIQEAWDPAFTPDGQGLLAVTRFKLRKVKGRNPMEDMEFATHAVSLVDLKSGKVRHIVQTPDQPLDFGECYAAPAMSADGRLVVYQDSFTDVSGGFHVVRLTGEEIFRYPPDPEKDYRPYWRPQFSPDGGRILCFSMPISEKERPWIYLVDLKGGQATRIAEGYYPTFVDGGRAMVFERWTPPVAIEVSVVKKDLMRLDLTPGAKPRLILTNAEKPAGF